MSITAWRAGTICLLMGLLYAGPLRAQEPEAVAIDDQALRPKSNTQVANGFILGANFGVGPSLAGGGFSSSGGGFVAPSIKAGLLVGGKLGRVMLHVGLDYLGLDSVGGTSSSTHIGVVQFWLGLHGVLWRSSDQRVELVGAVRLGPGVSFQTGSGSSASSTIPLLGYELTPGARYWVHRHFAFTALAGVGGLYQFATGNASGAAGVHSLVASLGGILAI